jgi:cell division protein FtsN
MPKDFKNNPAPRGERRPGHPLLVGIVIGLLLGVGISLGVALWLNRLSNPFVDKGKPVEPLARIGPAQPAPAETKGGGKATTDKSGIEKPRFEFYTMLPGEREVTPRDAKAEKAKDPPKDPPKDAAKEPAKTGPGSSPAQPKPHTGETYWLQAGAFADEKDADNLKAKIALSGLEASVKPAEIPNKGVLHRVRLGPYQSLEDANRIKASLSASGIGTTLIRADEAKNR